MARGVWCVCVVLVLSVSGVFPMSSRNQGAK